MLDIAKATRYLDSHAEPDATGKCARYVREALTAGGLDLSHHPLSAKDYGPTLEINGLAPLSRYAGAQVSPTPPTETPQAGDVIVIQPYAGGDPNGHIAMYDGTLWVSDFKQRDLWAGPGYRAAKPAYAIYRPRP